MVAGVQVTHLGGSYRVIVQPGATALVEAFVAERFPGMRAVTIADATVAAALPSPLPTAAHLTFPAGEHSKNRDSWLRLTDQLLDLRCGRDTVLIAFGGGVTTDLAGFVAATLHRGIPWIAVPTTTLAMIDAAVGGKTGVDTAAGKNLVGAFHPPAAVFADPMTLQTLPHRAYVEGLAEAVKHAAILDASYGEWMIDEAAGILSRAPSTVTELVRRSVVLKADVVSRDEHEGGRRAILNAGHTVAHALEQVTNYGIPHGEAVAIGLVLESRVAEHRGIASAGTTHRIIEILAALGLPHEMPSNIDRALFLKAMQSDKKNRGGQVRAAFLAEFGRSHQSQGEWTQPLDFEALQSAL